MITQGMLSSYVVSCAILLMLGGCVEDQPARKGGVAYFEALRSSRAQVVEEKILIHGKPARRIGYSPDGKRWRRLEATEAELNEAVATNPGLAGEAEAYQDGYAEGMIRGEVIGRKNADDAFLDSSTQPQPPSPPACFSQWSSAWASGWRRGFGEGYSKSRSFSHRGR